MLRQAGERAATAARLAEQRLQPAAADAPADSMQRSSAEQAAAAAVTGLVLVALTYCWQDLAEQARFRSPPDCAAWCLVERCQPPQQPDRCRCR